MNSEESNAYFFYNIFLYNFDQVKQTMKLLIQIALQICSGVLWSTLEPLQSRNERNEPHHGKLLRSYSSRDWNDRGRYDLNIIFDPIRFL